MAEGQVLLDTVGVGYMNKAQAAQAPAAFGALGLTQVPSACATAQDFARGRDLETFGHGLLRLNAFGASHKFNLL